MVIPAPPTLTRLTPPPLIPKPDALLFPPAQGRRGAWLSLLHQCQVKYCRHGDVLWHTGVASGYIIPNHLQPIFHQPLSDGGGTPSGRSGTEASSQKSTVLPDDVGPSTPAECGALRPMYLLWRAAPTEPPPHRTSQRSLCPPPTQTKRQENQPHFLCALCRFRATAVQSISSEDRILPRHLKASTFSRIWPRAWKSDPEDNQAALAARPPDKWIHHTFHTVGREACPCWV